MIIAELRDLFDYNRWAHEKTLDSAALLGPEKYADTSTSPTLSSVLRKNLTEEVVWLGRWQGHSLAEPPDYSECADATALMERWKSVWKRQQGFLESLSEDELRHPVSIRTRDGLEAVQSLGETMRHVVNQSTYLRGEAAMIIQQLGGSAPKADYFTYCLERGSNGDDV